VTYPRETARLEADSPYATIPAGSTTDPFGRLDPPSTDALTAVLPASLPGGAEHASVLSTEEVIELQRERFGGMKIGSAFFGWLCATATAALLAGAVAAVGSALGFRRVLAGNASANDLQLDSDTAMWIGLGVLLAIVLGAFYCGGYVAGRMARFSGLLQGLAVWLWAVLVALVAAVGGYFTVGQAVLLGVVDGLPRMPVPDDAQAIAVVVAIVAVAATSLGGALLGGVVGVRYHRRVDRVALEDSDAAGRFAA